MSTQINVDIKEIMERTIYDTVSYMIEKDMDFILMLWKTDDWEHPLPEQYQNEDFIYIAVEKQTLLDSLVDDNNRVIINTRFGDEDNSKVLYKEDIMCLLEPDMTALMANPYAMKPDKEKYETMIEDISSIIRNTK